MGSNHLLRLFCIQYYSLLQSRRDRPGFLSCCCGHRFAIIFELDKVFSNKELVSIFQGRLAYLLAVYVCPVQRSEVLDGVMVLLPIHLGVVAGDSKIVDLQRVVGQAANGQGSLGEGDLFQHCLFEL